MHILCIMNIEIGYGNSVNGFTLLQKRKPHAL